MSFCGQYFIFDSVLLNFKLPVGVIDFGKALKRLSNILVIYS